MDMIAFSSLVPCSARARTFDVSIFTCQRSIRRSRVLALPCALHAIPRMSSRPHESKHEQGAFRKHSRRRVLSTGVAGLGGLAAAALEVSASVEGASPTGVPSAVGNGPDLEDLAKYRGPVSLGYEFLYPSVGWTVKKKPIKTHLSEIVVANTKGRASSIAGVTVDAVKIGKIDEFGTPNDVGLKVVAVEKKKDSVMSAALISTETVTYAGLTYYVIEYTVESGRGLKKYLAKATITGGNLYVITAQAKVDDFDGVDGPVLALMVDSFRVAPQFL